MAEEKKIRPIIATSPSEAALQTIDELNAKDISLEEFLGPDLAKTIDEPKVPLSEKSSEVNQSENLEEVVKHLSDKQEVPGSSLARSPDNAFPWESPPTFTSPREAQDAMFGMLSTPEVTENILKGLSMGMPVTDLTSILVFKGFIDGAYNPDVALLISEPVAFFIMALGEKANIDYKIESDDSDLDDLERTSIDDRALEELEKAGGIGQIQKAIKEKEVSKRNIPADIVKEVEQRVTPSLLAPSTDTTVEAEPEQTENKTESLLSRT